MIFLDGAEEKARFDIEDDIKYDNEEMVKNEPTKGTFEEIDSECKEREK